MKKHFSHLVRWAGVASRSRAARVAAAAQTTPISPTGGRLVILSKLDGPPLPADLTILEDYGAFVLAQVPDTQLAALPQANIMDLMTDRTVISLNGSGVGHPAGGAGHPGQPARRGRRPLLPGPVLRADQEGVGGEPGGAGRDLPGLSPQLHLHRAHGPGAAGQGAGGPRGAVGGALPPGLPAGVGGGAGESETDGERIALEVLGFRRRGRADAPGRAGKGRRHRSGSLETAEDPARPLWASAGAAAPTGGAAGGLPGRGLRSAGADQRQGRADDAHLGRVEGGPQRPARRT